MLIFSFILIIVLTVVDQLIKLLVVNNLKPIGSFTVIPGLLEFKYIENRGAAFGIMQNFAWVFAVLTVIMTIGIIIYLIKYKHHNFWSYSASIMVISGGIGNLIDRVLNGFVVDYIHVMFFDYIFNFADCLVVVGVCFFFVFVLFFMDKEKEKIES